MTELIFLCHVSSMSCVTWREKDIELKLRRRPQYCFEHQFKFNSICGKWKMLLYMGRTHSSRRFCFMRLSDNSVCTLWTRI